MVITEKYVEYNMVNSIPIIHPEYQHIIYSPRYFIADADKLLHCFDEDKKEICIQKTTMRYIRITLDHGFKTFNNEVKALYFYIVVDNTIDFEGFDFKNTSKLLRWLQYSKNNHYVLVTTPVLQYKHIYYNIANDNNINILYHKPNELMNDQEMLAKLINRNCYTICDNYNIVISLYQKQIISKTDFKSILGTLNQLKNFYYTTTIWLHLLNNHRLISACDFPILYMSMTPQLMHDDDIFNLFNCHDIESNMAFMQTMYKKQVFFTTFISASYPHTDLKYLERFLGINNIWFNHNNLPKQCWIFDKDSIFVNDLYGLFASFVHKNDMWNYWIQNKTILIEKLIENNKCILYDIFYTLFVLYKRGYEGITIKKRRIHTIWIDIMKHPMITAPTMTEIFQQFGLCCGGSVPYVFLLDMYRHIDIDFGKNHLILNKCSNIYSMLKNRDHDDSFNVFYKNVLKRRSIYILMCIYKKFGLLSTSQYNKKIEVGRLLIEYLRENMYYLL
jgi:hypothetical protein